MASLYYILISVIISFLTFLFLLFIYFKHSFKYWPKRNVPHPKPTFPFGNFNIRLKNEAGLTIRDIYSEMKKKGAKFCGYNLFSIPFFMPLTPELYKEVLVKKFHCFQSFGMICNEDYDPMSGNLVCLSGQKWKDLRQKLSPMFNPTKIKTMFSLIEECSVKINEILEKTDKINIHDFAIKYTADVICSCAFGIESNNLINSNSEFYENGMLLTDMGIADSMRFMLGMMAPNISKRFKINFFNPKLTDFFYRIVKETIEYRKQNNVRRNDLMDMLIRLKNNEKIDDDYANNEKGLSTYQIAAQAFIFFFAGFETSSVTLAFCMYELARNPEIQEKVRNEILTNKENNEPLTYEAINKMNYMDQVIYETLRKYPPLTILQRNCEERCEISDNLVIEKNIKMIISVLGIHHDPEFYPEPEIFNPERFSEEEKAKRPSFTFLPFGDGPRSCLGLKFAITEIKVGLCTLLRNYKYSVHSATKGNVRLKTNSNLLTLKDTVWLKPIKI